MQRLVARELSETSNYSKGEPYAAEALCSPGILLGKPLAGCESTGGAENLASSPAGTGQSTANDDASEMFTLTVEWTSPQVSGSCPLEKFANGVEGGPFSNGKSMDLKDENGVLLSRGNLDHDGPMTTSRCAMSTRFESVPRGAKNYVVHTSIGSTWTFLATEVDPGKVSVDYFETAGQG